MRLSYLDVQWFFLILDEAHNIKNFKSQRWQVRASIQHNHNHSLSEHG